MSNKSSTSNIVGPFRADQLPRSTPEHMAELRRMAESDERDYSDIPHVSSERIARAAEAQRLRIAAAGKERVTMFLDTDIVSAFRAQGPGYQTRINDALREYLTSGRADKTPAELLDDARRAIDRMVPTVQQWNGTAPVRGSGLRTKGQARIPRTKLVTIGNRKGARKMVAKKR